MKSVAIRAVMLLSCLSSACAAVEESDAPAMADAVRAKDDELVACSKVGNGQSGSLRIFRLGDASEKESRQWGKTVVAVGFKGELDDWSVGYSQGDQPVLGSSRKDGKAYDLDFFEKKCAGKCSNTMVLSDGSPGEDQGFKSVTVKTLHIDEKAKTVRLVGVREGFGVTESVPLTIDYENCDLNTHVIDDVHKALQ